MNGCIAVLNAGSSSIKFALYDSANMESPRYRGQVEQIGVSPRLHVVDAGGKRVSERNWPADGFDHQTATNVLLETSKELLRGEPVAAVGHRVVHGGTDYAAPMRIDPDVISALSKLTPLAPLHQ